MLAIFILEGALLTHSVPQSKHILMQVRVVGQFDQFLSVCLFRWLLDLRLVDFIFRRDAAACTDDSGMSKLRESVQSWLTLEL